MTHPEQAWTTWGQPPAPQGGGPGRGPGRRALWLGIGIPAGILVVLAVAVGALVLLTDPAGAAGACGGG